MDHFYAIFLPFILNFFFFLHTNMELNSNEKKNIMIFQNFKKNSKFIIQIANKIYEIFHITLIHQYDGKQSQYNISINSKNLIDLKDIIFEYIINWMDCNF